MIRAINITPKLLYRDGFFLLSVTLLIYFLFFGFNGWDINDNISVIEGFYPFSCPNWLYYIFIY